MITQGSSTTIPTIPTIPTMSAYLFFNRTADKTSFDRMVLTKKNRYVTVTYADDYVVGRKGICETYSITDFHQYMKNVFDMLEIDADESSYSSVDVLIPGYPVVCMDYRNNESREVVMRSLTCWLLA